jgi:hypothetical protein
MPANPEIQSSVPKILHVPSPTDRTPWSRRLSSGLQKELMEASVDLSRMTLYPGLPQTGGQDAEAPVKVLRPFFRIMDGARDVRYGIVLPLSLQRVRDYLSVTGKGGTTTEDFARALTLVQLLFSGENGYYGGAHRNTPNSEELTGSALRRYQPDRTTTIWERLGQHLPYGLTLGFTVFTVAELLGSGDLPPAAIPLVSGGLTALVTTATAIIRKSERLFASMSEQSAVATSVTALPGMLRREAFTSDGQVTRESMKRYAEQGKKTVKTLQAMLENTMQRHDYPDDVKGELARLILFAMTEIAFPGIGWEVHLRAGRKMAISNPTQELEDIFNASNPPNNRQELAELQGNYKPSEVEARAELTGGDAGRRTLDSYQWLTANPATLAVMSLPWRFDRTLRRQMSQKDFPGIQPFNLPELYDLQSMVLGTLRDKLLGEPDYITSVAGLYAVTAGASLPEWGGLDGPLGRLALLASIFAFTDRVHIKTIDPISSQDRVSKQRDAIFVLARQHIGDVFKDVPYEGKIGLPRATRTETMEELVRHIPQLASHMRNGRYMFSQRDVVRWIAHRETILGNPLWPEDLLSFVRNCFGEVNGQLPQLQQGGNQAQVTSSEDSLISLRELSGFWLSSLERGIDRVMGDLAKGDTSRVENKLKWLDSQVTKLPCKTDVGLREVILVLSKEPFARLAAHCLDRIKQESDIGRMFGPGTNQTALQVQQLSWGEIHELVARKPELQPYLNTLREVQTIMVKIDHQTDNVCKQNGHWSPEFERIVALLLQNNPYLTRDTADSVPHVGLGAFDTYISHI